MAYQHMVDVKCSNKLCDYEGQAGVFNAVTLEGKIVCPKCGFKTLEEAWRSRIPEMAADKVAL